MSIYRHTLMQHTDVLTGHIEIDKLYQNYKECGYEIMMKLPNSFVYKLSDGIEIMVYWDKGKGIIFEDVLNLPQI